MNGSACRHEHMHVYAYYALQHGRLVSYEQVQVGGGRELRKSGIESIFPLLLIDNY